MNETPWRGHEGTFQAFAAADQATDIDDAVAAVSSLQGLVVRSLVALSPSVMRCGCDAGIAQCGVCRSTSRVSRSSGRRGSGIAPEARITRKASPAIPTRIITSTTTPSGP